MKDAKDCRYKERGVYAQEYVVSEKTAQVLGCLDAVTLISN